MDPEQWAEPLTNKHTPNEHAHNTGVCLTSQTPQLAPSTSDTLQLPRSHLRLEQLHAWIITA